MQIERMGIQDIRKGLEEKQFSAQELAEAALTRIAETDAELHAFLHATDMLAREQAQAIDERIHQGAPLPLLAGVPCAIKDAILVKDIPSTAGSRILEPYVAAMDATAVARMKEEGALLVGKTNMDEFAMGASTENSAFGPTKNPWDKARVPGGSSGGSAVAVAAGQSVVSLGSDTGGSIRLPASFCGVVGLKPTYGAVSRSGLIALASSLDQIGPFARSVEDAETVFHAIRGKDGFDATSVDYDYPASQETGAEGLRVGVPREYLARGLDPEIEARVKEALSKLEQQGAILEEVTLPHTEYALASYYVINTSEASANLARYDAIRFGQGAGDGGDLQDWYLDSRGRGLGPEVKRRIMLGTYALSAGYYEAFYVKAQKMRTLLKQDFEKAFEKVDVIVGPVSPFLPFPLNEKIEDPLAMYLVDVYTVPVNLAGLPGMAVPVGRSASGLPIGLQIICPWFREDLAFRAGKAVQSLYGTIV